MPLTNKEYLAKKTLLKVLISNENS